jgi:SAM-dependent methyltransferase
MTIIAQKRERLMKHSKANYGNWIRKRILVSFLSIGLLFLAIAVIVDGLPWPVRAVLLIPAGLFLFGFLYFFYVYLQLSERGGDLQTKLRNRVLEPLTWNGEGRALDIGTGNGPLAVSLAKKYPQAQVIGIDFWGKNWEYSQETCERNAVIENVADRVRFQQASAARLPFDDGVFDVAVSHFVFHEISDVSDKRDVIQEALRVVRQGGEFSFHDLFFEEQLYGPIDDLLDTIWGWGIQEVQLIDTRHAAYIPRLLRHRRVLGAIGILYGKK